MLLISANIRADYWLFFLHASHLKVFLPNCETGCMHSFSQLLEQRVVNTSSVNTAWIFRLQQHKNT